MNHKVVFSGNLDFLSLGDLLQLLGSNGSTGILRIKSQYMEDPGLIHIAEGNPANASIGALTGLEALNSLFGWVEGEFEFSKEPITAEKIIKKSRMEILLDALRMLDDGVIEKIGPVTAARSAIQGDKDARIPFVKGPLVDYTYVVAEEAFSDGDKITEQGKHGDWIWVVLEGAIEVVKETPQGPFSILKLGSGAFIGSVATFLMGGSARSATVYAVGDVQVGVLDSQRLSTDYATSSDEFRGFVVSLDKRLRQVSERAVAAHFNLKQNGVTEVIEGRTPVFKQGVNDDRILRIAQGEASIVRKTDHGSVLLANLDKRDIIGNIPFLNIGHEPHSASVLASKDFEVSEISADDLHEEYARLSPTLRNIVEHVAICVSVTTSVVCELEKETGSKPSKNA
jgi:CRP-like cAMP-binding protein